MIGYRDGHVITMCNACYRPRRTGDAGWQHRDEGGLPATTAMGDPEHGRKQGRPVEQPEMGLDYCPTCADELQARPDVLRRHLADA